MKSCSTYLRSMEAPRTWALSFFAGLADSCFCSAVVTAFTNQQGSADRVVAVVLTFDRSVRVMQCGLFCLLMILCRLLRNCWRQQVFGSLWDSECSPA